MNKKILTSSFCRLVLFFSCTSSPMLGNLEGLKGITNDLKNREVFSPKFVMSPHLYQEAASNVFKSGQSLNSILEKCYTDAQKEKETEPSLSVLCAKIKSQEAPLLRNLCSLRGAISSFCRLPESISRKEKAFLFRERGTSETVSGFDLVDLVHDLNKGLNHFLLAFTHEPECTYSHFILSDGLDSIKRILHLWEHRLDMFLEERTSEDAFQSLFLRTLRKELQISCDIATKLAQLSAKQDKRQAFNQIYCFFNTSLNVFPGGSESYIPLKRFLANPNPSEQTQITEKGSLIFDPTSLMSRLSKAHLEIRFLQLSGIFNFYN